MGNTSPNSSEPDLQSGMTSAGSNLNNQPSSSESQHWIHCSSDSAPPLNAVIAGNEADGAVIYVGRTSHNGDMLVVKFVPSECAAYVTSHGEEIKKEKFELLCGENFVWRQCYEDFIPQSAVICGTTKFGDLTYIGRGSYEGGLIVGKILTTHRALFIPHNGTERRLDTYEMLLQDNTTLGWSIPKETGNATELPPPPPYDSIFSPPEADQSSTPDLSVLFVETPQEHPSPSERPKLTQPQVSPIPHPIASVQQQKKSTPMNNPNEIWVSSLGRIPENAFVAGNDVDKSDLYICRVAHEGDIIPGKIVRSHGCAYITFHDKEIAKYHYETLVGNKYVWARSGNGKVKKRAVEGGRTKSGETLYIGRAHYKGAYTPGKIFPSRHCLLISFEGKCLDFDQYEILLHA